MTKKLAEELKEARLKKDITLQQLFVKTRIDIKFLEAIENGNFEVLPDVYLRAFIKSYASAVGLDEATIMKKFDAARSGKDYDDSRHQAESHAVPKEERRPAEPRVEKKKEYIAYDANSADTHEETSPSRSAKNNIIWIVLAGVLLIAALLLYLIFFRGSSSQIITEKPYDEYLENNSQRFEDTTQNTSTSAKADSQNTAAQQQQPVTTGRDSLSLLIKSSAQSWIKVTADDNAKTYEFILKPNTQRDIKAKKNYHLIVGNAGSVQLQLNNRPLDLQGKSGEVRIAQVDSTGLVYTRSSKPSSKPAGTNKPGAATNTQGQTKGPDTGKTR